MYFHGSIQSIIWGVVRPDLSLLICIFLYLGNFPSVIDMYLSQRTTNEGVTCKFLIPFLLGAKSVHLLFEDSFYSAGDQYVFESANHWFGRHMQVSDPFLLVAKSVHLLHLLFGSLIPYYMSLFFPLVTNTYLTQRTSDLGVTCKFLIFLSVAKPVHLLHLLFGSLTPSAAV